MTDFKPTLMRYECLGCNMQEAEESWVPHLLGFILPIVTIAGIYQGGYWAFSGFVYALGICFHRLFSPERAPVRGEVSTALGMRFITRFFLCVHCGSLWRANSDGFTPLSLEACQ